MSDKHPKLNGHSPLHARSKGGGLFHDPFVSAAVHAVGRAAHAVGEVEAKSNRRMHAQFVKARNGGTLYTDHSHDVPKPKRAYKGRH